MRNTILSLGKIEIPLMRVMVGNVVAYASALAQAISLDKSEIYHVELAVEEALSNAIIHYSTPAQLDEHVLTEFFLEGGFLIISVREKGIPYDHRKSARYSPDSLEQMQYPGLGEFLLNKVMDKVEVLSHGREGKEIRLYKQISQDSLPEEITQMSLPKRRMRPTVKEGVIRIASEDDASEICRLAWRCYGYTQEAVLYDVTLLQKKIASGELVSVVAIDPQSQQIIGHMALKYHDDSKVPELGLAFIDPSFRCPGLSAMMSGFIARYSQKKGDKGIFDCSVTTHIFSQKANQTEFGSTPCCIMLGIAAKGMQAKELSTVVQEKGSVVNHFLPFMRDKKTVYAPDKHRQMIARIYQWLEMPRNFADIESEKTCGVSEVFSFPLPEELNASFIIVNSIGGQTGQEISQNLENWNKNRMDAVYLFLPLCDPGLPEIVTQAEKDGFFFAGVMPHIHAGGDRLLMQYINIDLDPENIRLFGEKSKELFNYIQSEQENTRKR